MQVKETGFDGLVELIPTVYHDDRGWFFEFYKEPTLKLFGIDHKFPQENLSFSKKRCDPRPALSIAALRPDKIGHCAERMRD